MEVTPEDRQFIERLKAAIADPATPAEQRAELREELGEILHSYVVAEHLAAYEDATEDAAHPPGAGTAPSYDQTMALLATVMETYSWPVFKAILYDEKGLKVWLTEKLGLPEPSRYLDPEDPAAVELSELTADQEHEAMMFLNELTPEEKGKLKAAMLDLWGKEGAAMLPF